MLTNSTCNYRIFTIINGIVSAHHPLQISKFTKVPEEALISAMKAHQKYFHMLDAKGKLLPAFISVANIESSDLSMV
jgi:hypothetical protein